MNTSHLSRNLVLTGLLAGSTLGMLQGCEELGDLAKQCGLVCPDEGILEGNASISGVASVDSFFSALVSLKSATANLQATIHAELVGMAKILEIAGAAELSLSDLTAAVTAELEAEFAANIEGSLTINFEPPKCSASLEVSAKAAAECDVDVDPGSIEAKCSGSCEVSAEVAAMCEAEGTLKCEGTAPNFECEGSCTGSCQLEASAACEGTCNGSCEGECTVCAGGACDNQGGVVTNCAGSCSAGCQGECKLEAGGSCGGRCEGSCEYTPPSGGCEASATAKCDVSGMAEAKCEGKCEGSVEPPEVKAECKASVEAKASAEVECTPPQLSVSFQFAAGVDANAQAAFKAKLEGLKARFAGMLAARAKLEIIADAFAKVAVEGVAAVEGGVDAALSGGADLKAKIGLGCAITQLGLVGDLVGEATGEISASVSAVTSVSGSFGAG